MTAQDNSATVNTATTSTSQGGDIVCRDIFKWFGSSLIIEGLDLTIAPHRRLRSP